MLISKRFVWLAAGAAFIWIALGCSSLPYSNNPRPSEPPAVPEIPPQPAVR